MTPEDRYVSAPFDLATAHDALRIEVRRISRPLELLEMVGAGDVIWDGESYAPVGSLEGRRRDTLAPNADVRRFYGTDPVVWHRVHAPDDEHWRALTSL